MALRFALITDDLAAEYRRRAAVILGSKADPADTQICGSSTRTMNRSAGPGFGHEFFPQGIFGLTILTRVLVH